jgi:hypothetical protein
MKVTKSQLKKIIAEELQLNEVKSAARHGAGVGVAGGTAVALGSVLSLTGAGAIVGGPLAALGGLALAYNAIKKRIDLANLPFDEPGLVEFANEIWKTMMTSPDRGEQSGRKTLDELEAALGIKLKEVENPENFKFAESEIEAAEGEPAVATAVLNALKKAGMLLPDKSDKNWRRSQAVIDTAHDLEPAGLATGLAKKAIAIGGPGAAPWNEGKTTKITRSQLMQVINEELETTLDELGNYSQAAGASLRNAQLTGKRDDDTEVDPYERALEAPLAEEEDDNWIQGAEKDIEKRGTEGVCTGDKFGGPTCKPGTKRYNLAKTFRKMAKKRKKS